MYDFMSLIKLTYYDVRFTTLLNMLFENKLMIS